jgi:hypothetical protein
MTRVAMVLVLSGCLQSTGGQLVSFALEGRGDPAVATGQPLHFTSGRGFDVTLVRAKVTVGAVYFNRQNPQSYTLEQSCVQTGVYSGEVRGGLTLDALDPTPQPFPVEGNGTDAQTLAAELWLTGGDILATDDQTPILDVAGVASQGGTTWPFTGLVTIGANRVVPPRNTALPGSSPLCQQRIVAPIAFSTQLAQGSTVQVLVDARAWFADVDFSSLEQVGPQQYQFSNDGSSSRQADQALYNGLRAFVGPYRFTTAGATP